jgi:NADH-quinone oxidoreductase subunit F
MMTQNDTPQTTILICQGTGCLSSRSDEIQDEFSEQLKNFNLQDKIKVDFTGCHGFCAQGPIVIIEPEGVMYSKVKTTYVNEIVNSHLKDGIPVEKYFYI